MCGDLSADPELAQRMPDVLERLLVTMGQLVLCFSVCKVTRACGCDINDICQRELACRAHPAAAMRRGVAARRRLSASSMDVMGRCRAASHAVCQLTAEKVHT